MLNNAQRGKGAVITFILLGVTILLTLVSNLYQYQVYSNIDYASYDDMQVTVSDLLQALTNLASLGARLLFIVFFLLWLYRAYSNLAAAGVKGLQDAGWAAGAWFVPIINLYRPYQIVRETYEETAMATFPPEEKYRNKPNTTIIGFWWATFLLARIVTVFATNTFEWDLSIEQIREEAYMGAISNLVEFIPFFLLLTIIRRTMAFEKKLWEQHQNEEFGISDSDRNLIY